MAISFVNAAAVVASASGTAVTTAMPTGWAAGDILILSIDNNTQATVTSAPSDPGTTWNSIRRITDSTVLATDLYWAVATSISAAPTATLSGNSKWITQIAAYRGVDNTNPFSSTPAENGTNETGTSTTHTTPSVTNPDANGWAVVSMCTRGLTSGSWTPNAALTERLDNTTSSSSQIASCFDDSNGTVATGANSYSNTASASGSVATMWLGFLKPAASGTQFNQSVTATATLTPSLVKQAGKILSVTSTLTPSVAKQAVKALAFTATLTPSVVKRVVKTLTPTALTESATLQVLKVSFVNLTASAVTTTSSLVRQVGKVLAPSQATSSSIKRAVSKTITLTSTLTPSLAVLKVQFITLTATAVSQTATLARQVGKPLAAITNAIPFVTKRISTTKTAGQTLAGAVVKQALLARSATQSSSASLTKRSTLSVVLTATQGLLATFTKNASIVARFFFRPPTHFVGSWYAKNFYTYYVNLPTGISVLKKDGVYTQVQSPDQNQVRDADIAYIGGYTYEITADEAAALQAAGYTVENS